MTLLADLSAPSPHLFSQFLLSEQVLSVSTVEELSVSLVILETVASVTVMSLSYFALEPEAPILFFLVIFLLLVYSFSNSYSNINHSYHHLMVSS